MKLLVVEDKPSLLASILEYFTQEDFLCEGVFILDKVSESRGGNPSAATSDSVSNTLDIKMLDQIIGAKGELSKGVYKSKGTSDKMIVSWLVADRDAESANLFMNDVAKRLKNRVQLTTDGLKAYLEAVTDSFGSQIDFAQLVKIYGKSEGLSATERKYSPAECTGAEKIVRSGNPDEKHISTSYVERQNLTMRMHMRRFTRLTNAFTKKIENHCYAIALHFVYYNFVKQHKTLRITPAMAADLTKRFMSIEDIVRLAD